MCFQSSRISGMKQHSAGSDVKNVTCIDLETVKWLWTRQSRGRVCVGMGIDRFFIVVNAIIDRTLFHSLIDFCERNVLTLIYTGINVKFIPPGDAVCRLLLFPPLCEITDSQDVVQSASYCVKLGRNFGHFCHFCLLEMEQFSIKYCTVQHSRFNTHVQLLVYIYTFWVQTEYHVTLQSTPVLLICGPVGKRS